MASKTSLGMEVSGLLVCFNLGKIFQQATKPEWGIPGVVQRYFNLEVIQFDILFALKIRIMATKNLARYLYTLKRVGEVRESPSNTSNRTIKC